MYDSDYVDYEGGIIMGGCAMCGNCPYDGGVLLGGSIKGSIKVSTAVKFINKYLTGFLMGEKITNEATASILNDANNLGQVLFYIKDEKLDIINKNDVKTYNILYNRLKDLNLGQQFITTAKGFSIPLIAKKPRTTSKNTTKRPYKYPCTEKKALSLKTQKGRDQFIQRCGNIVQFEPLLEKPLKQRKSCGPKAFNKLKTLSAQQRFIAECNAAGSKRRGVIQAGVGAYNPYI